MTTQEANTGTAVALGSIQRMPIGFGPALGPRQGPDGQRYGETPHRTTKLSVSFETDPERLAAILPPGFTLGDPVVRVDTAFSTGMGWLAGRGYNMVEVVLPATYHGDRETIEGDYVAVMWESLADALIVGREELGAPKLYAEVTEPSFADGRTSVSAYWDRFTFVEMAVDDLELSPWPEDTGPVAPAGPAAGRPRLYRKYFPRTGEWGRADVDCTTTHPALAQGRRIVQSWTGTGSVRFHHARWEDLPTFAPVVNAFAELPVREFRGASMTRTEGFYDLYDVRVAE